MAANAPRRSLPKHGLTIEQQLAEEPDGRTVLNRLAVYKLGVRVATLSETIRKLG